MKRVSMNRIEILREKITKLVGLLTERKVSVTQRGLQAYVRFNKEGVPEIVNIPFIPDNATSEFAQAIEGFLDHEVAHVIFTDGAIIKKADKLGVGGFHNAVEDIFIESEMSKKFPGSKSNLETMHGLFIRDYIEANYQKALDRPVEQLIVALLRAYAGQGAFVDYIADKLEIPKLKEVDLKLRDYCVKQLPIMRTSEDALDIALHIRKLLAPPKNEEKQPPPPKKQEDKEKGEPNQESGETPEDEGKSGNSTEQDENNDEPPPKGNKPEEEEKDDKNTDSDKQSKPDDSAEDKDGTGEGEDDTSDGTERDDDKTEGGSDTGGDVSDTGDNDDESESGNDDSAGNSSSDSDDLEEEEKPAKPKKSAGEDTSDSDGEKTESDSGSQSDESEKEGDQDSGKDGKGAKPTEPDKGIEGDKPQSTSDSLDQVEHGHEGGPNIDPVELQKALKDFDEAMSELITAEAMETAKSSQYLIYSKDFDVIEKFDTDKKEGVKPNAVSKMQDKVDHMVGKLQRDLERAVAAQSKTSWNLGRRTGVIDNSALTRLVNFGEQKVFKRKVETKGRNSAVTLLIDCSGSMHNEKITVASYAAYALSSTLERLGINHEILGFTTIRGGNEELHKGIRASKMEYSRYDAIYMPVFKSFGERITSQVKEGLASLATANWLANNIDGESLAVAAQRLCKQKEERKILIVLSDGRPAGHGDAADLSYHLEKTVKDIMASNIEVLGIGILDRSVEKYYPKSVVINKLEDLPSTIITQIRKLLTS